MEEQRFSDEVAFSLELPAKTVRLLGTEVLFPGSYFVERYTNEFFHGKFTALGQDIEQQIRTLELDGDSIAINIRAAVIQNGIDGGIREIEEFASSVGLDSGTENEIVSQYQTLILAFGDQIEEVGPLFAQIDAGVDDAILCGEYKKALRPRVQSYGVGLTGLAKAVATQSVLNAGIGLAYSAANKANTGFVKSAAQSRKKELLENCIKIVRDFFSEGDRAVPAICLEIIKERSPAAIWTQDDKRIQALETAYEGADNDALF